MARLLRGCLDCRTLVRGKSRCVDCQRKRDQRKAKARPDLHNDRAERERRRKAVATWRATMGDWCPGVPELGRPAHPAAHLQADHAVEVAAGGPVSGPLVVRCGPCNSARSANVRRRAEAALGGFPIGAWPPTPAQPNARLLSAPRPAGQSPASVVVPEPADLTAHEAVSTFQGVPRAADGAMGRSGGHPTPLDDDGPVVA